MPLVQIHYSGRVQGVGFRYTVSSIAKKLKISGTVMNLPDGRVEICVSGELGGIEQFIKTIDEHFQRNITDKATVELKGEHTFQDFQIIT